MRAFARIFAAAAALAACTALADGEQQKVDDLERKIRENLVDIRDDGSYALNMRYFRYATGLRMYDAARWQALFGVPENIPHIPLPIGISFYTFQLLSYVVDVYRGNAKCATKFHELLLYASLFHQCIAGPIIRYSDVHREIRLRKKTPNPKTDIVQNICL